MDFETMTDILLICKGWYDKTKYNGVLEALNAYYHKHYGCGDITMDKAFAEYLFLRPLALHAIEVKPKIARYIFDPIYSPFDNNQPFGETMYDRLMGLIQMIDKDTFDLSRYQEMFQKAEACNYKDDTIGII